MDEENRTHYDILGVSPDASSEDIDSAYVRVLQAHKPKMESDSQTKERVQEINEAYDAIGHEAARVVYDIKRLAPPGSTELPSKDEQQAASILGQLGFEIGLNIGFGIQDELTRLGVGGKRTKLGIWHAAFLAALIQINEGERDVPNEATAYLIRAANSGSVRGNILKWHEEASPTLAEAQAREIAIQTVGTMASAMGHGMGKVVGMLEKPKGIDPP